MKTTLKKNSQGFLNLHYGASFVDFTRNKNNETFDAFRLQLKIVLQQILFVFRQQSVMFLWS